jgi:uncharacterized protein YgiM (DUF1202 family)
MTKTKKVLWILIPLLLIGGGIFALTRKKKPVTTKRKPAKFIFGDLTGGILQDSMIAYTKQDARLRTEPNTASEIVKTFNIDDSVFITSSAQGTDGVWYEVNDGEGNSGWMREDVLNLV